MGRRGRKCRESDITTNILTTQLAPCTLLALTDTVENNYRNRVEGGVRDRKKKKKVFIKDSHSRKVENIKIDISNAAVSS